MTATDFTIADPNDVNMMDVVGFDSASPLIMRDFIVSGFETCYIESQAVADEAWDAVLSDE